MNKIFLVIFCIIISIKLLYTVDKMNIILADLEKKLKSVDGVFEAVSSVTNAILSISDGIVSKTLTLVDKIFKKDK